MSTALIREAKETDIEPVAKLFQQWFEEDSAYGFIPDDPERIRSAISPYFLVAEVGGAIVGFIAGSVHVSEGLAVVPAGTSYLEIDNLYVAPAFRKQGIGSSLVTQLLNRAREQGVTHSLLYSSMKDMHRIARFYEKHNFKSWYIQMFQEL